MFKLPVALAFLGAVGAAAAAEDNHWIKLTAAEAGDDVMQVERAGKICLWIAFAGLFIPALYMGMSSMSQPDGKRYFHTVSFLINAIASIAYLAMANGYGCVFVYGKDNVYRQFFYARYIDWSLTTPLQLLDLAGLAGASNDTTLWLLATDFLMIVSGLIGGLIGGSDKACWGFWIFGMMAYIPIVYLLAVALPGSNCSAAASSIYKKTATLTVVFWTAYPVVWILAEGTSVISSDVECILYTILDIIAKSVFGILIVSARDGLDAALEEGKM
jgi:bacteriorhodopsin